MNDVINIISLSLAVSSLLISLKAFIKTLRYDEYAMKVHILIGEVLETVKLNIECNKEFAKYIKGNEKNDCKCKKK